MLDAELKSKINQLWDKFWSGGISDPLVAITQMSYLIFMKRLEDLDNIHRIRAEATQTPYKSVFEEHDNCRWSNWKYMNASAMYKHVSETVFPFIKKLHNGEDVVYAEYMQTRLQNNVFNPKFKSVSSLQA